MNGSELHAPEVCCAVRIDVPWSMRCTPYGTYQFSVRKGGLT